MIVRSRNHRRAKFNSQRLQDSCGTVQCHAVVFVAFITRNLGFVDAQFLGELSLSQASCDPSRNQELAHALKVPDPIEYPAFEPLVALDLVLKLEVKGLDRIAVIAQVDNRLAPS
jgi:hypothetical protein